MWWRAPWLQQRWTLLSLALLDAALITGNYNFLFWRRFDRWAGITGSVAAVSIIWLGTSYLLGRYSQPEDRSRDNVFHRIAATTVAAIAVVFAVVVVGSWGLKAEDPRAFRSFVIPVLGASLMGSTAAQEIARRNKTFQRQWQVIASEPEQVIIRQELAANPPAQLIQVQLETSGSNLKDEKDITTRNQDFAVSETVSTSNDVIEALLSFKRQGATVCSLTTWCESHLQRIPPELFSSRWLAQAEGFDLRPGRLNWRFKRLGDLSLGCALLIASAPLVALAALAISLEDRGPVFYNQIRTGLYGEPFRIWKLRSMRINSESNGAQWSKSGDSRITHVGRWLRQLRIDEIPQLISVIKGEMSLIGPRPERPDIEAVLEREIPHYRVRHWIRPGLSGWAQVCYPYGASIEDSRAKLSYDLYYLRNASLGLDVLILIKTIRMLARRKGSEPKASFKRDCQRLP